MPPNLKVNRKNKRTQTIDAVFEFMGISIVGSLLYKYLTESPNGVHRYLVSQTLIDTEMFPMKDWVCEPDACDVCQDLAANSPYPIDEDISEPHNHCRCDEWPAY